MRKLLLIWILFICGLPISCTRKVASDVFEKKMTFPNDKLLTIEMTEQQISGRNISLNIDYEDVLSADSFNTALLEEE